LWTIGADIISFGVVAISFPAAAASWATTTKCAVILVDRRNPELMGQWALAAFYDQANNRLRLRFPLRGPSVFSLDRGVCAPLQFPSGMSLIN
jgi:hypothetical protein